jgi:hypothetical protein
MPHMESKLGQRTTKGYYVTLGSLIYVSTGFHIALQLETRHSAFIVRVCQMPHLTCVS